MVIFVKKHGYVRKIVETWCTASLQPETHAPPRQYQKKISDNATVFFPIITTKLLISLHRGQDVQTMRPKKRGNNRLVGQPLQGKSTGSMPF